MFGYFFESGRYDSVRRTIAIFGVVTSIILGSVLFYQGFTQTRGFYQDFHDTAWQVASLQLAQINTDQIGSELRKSYSLVTRDFGDVSLDLDLALRPVVDHDLLAEVDPDGKLKVTRSDNGIAFSGTFRGDGQEYHRSLFLVYYSADSRSYHLSPQGVLAGFICLTKPISTAKENLIAGHWLMFGIWLGSCAVLWFIIIGVGGSLLNELEATNNELFAAKRDALIDSIVCTYNHRINSPLMGIYGSIDLLSAAEEDPRKIRLIRSLGEAADRIKNATDEIAELEEYTFVRYSDDAEMIATGDLDRRDQQLHGAARRKFLRFGSSAGN
jgi:signal transduction histidine kinase